MTYDSISKGLNYVLNTISQEVPSRFFILGKTNVPLPADLPERARSKGCRFLSWSYGDQGSIFLLTNHSDLAQSEEMVVLKLGFTRLSSYDTLSAKDLLERKIATPHQIEHKAIHGNAVVVCISQQQPSFSMYQTLTASSQVYWWEDQNTLLFCDTLRLLVPLASPLDLNPDAVPLHFLFRYIAGEMTYFSGVHKILCGQLLSLWNNEVQVAQLERLDDWVTGKRIDTVSPAVIDQFDEQAEHIIDSYVHQVKHAGQDLLILLSGGVDSSLLTSYIKAGLSPDEKLRSASYAIEAPEFNSEIEYAQDASKVFDTTHQFMPVLARDYGSLLEQMVDLLAHPVSHEQDPCYLGLAKYFSKDGPRYLFSGSVADTLLGYESSKRLCQVERYHKIPLAQYGLEFLSRVVKGILPNKSIGLHETAFIIQSLKDPLSPYHPNSRDGLFTSLDRVQRCFGTEGIRKAIGYRVAEFEHYSSSKNLVERTHFIALTEGVHHDEAVMAQVFRSNNLETVTPYLDSDFVRATLAFDPNIRYFSMNRSKWLPKALVEKRLSNGKQLTQKSKRAGGFDIELRKWMKSGVLRDMVNDIHRPDYLSLKDFEQAKEDPDWFTWNLLTLDLFQKRVLGTQALLNSSYHSQVAIN
jgi:asparagine synthetase B (glutamine-hydrolysing)